MSRETDLRDPCAGGAPPPSRPGCVGPLLERLRFWNGRFLVARDLTHQQEDLIRRLEYHQHFAHGEGILCGFRVRRHPRSEDCEREWLVVDAGMAYDCCGRTLWMPESRAVRIPLTPVAPVPAGAGDERPVGEGEPGDAGEGDGEARPPEPEWFVVACRADCPADPQPALYADDLCQPVRSEHGRVREEVELRAVPAAQVSDACWPRRRPVTDADCTRGLDDDCAGPDEDTVPCGHGCDCGGCVVLAAVWRDADGGLRWDLTHRRVLVPPGSLTRITGVNWPHGGDLPLRRLVEGMGGRLVVRFSRRLRPAEGMRRGINPMTFEVSYLGQSGAWEQVLPPEEGDEGAATPSLSPNRRCAVFAIPRPLLHGRHSLAGSWVRVRLLGDLILDCHGRAVSAAHTGGDVGGRGSGNGVPGGTFESWFYVGHSWKEDER